MLNIGYLWIVIQVLIDNMWYNSCLKILLILILYRNQAWLFTNMFNSPMLIDQTFFLFTVVPMHF